jgi:hypothetical protein
MLCSKAALIVIPKYSQVPLTQVQLSEKMQSAQGCLRSLLILDVKRKSPSVLLVPRANGLLEGLAEFSRALTFMVMVQLRTREGKRCMGWGPGEDR